MPKMGTLYSKNNRNTPVKFKRAGKLDTMFLGPGAKQPNIDLEEIEAAGGLPEGIRFVPDRAPLSVRAGGPEESEEG